MTCGNSHAPPSSGNRPKRPEVSPSLRVRSGEAEVAGQRQGQAAGHRDSRGSSPPTACRSGAACASTACMPSRISRPWPIGVVCTLRRCSGCRPGDVAAGAEGALAAAGDDQGAQVVVVAIGRRSPPAAPGSCARSRRSSARSRFSVIRATSGRGISQRMVSPDWCRTRAPPVIGRPAAGGAPHRSSARTPVQGRRTRSSGPRTSTSICTFTAPFRPGVVMPSDHGRDRPGRARRERPDRVVGVVGGDGPAVLAGEGHARLGRSAASAASAVG